MKEFLEGGYQAVTESGCWIWMRTLSRDGYGIARRQRAHRISWLAHRGAIPGGLFVLHRCDVRCCINPDHLFLGTHADNTADRISKGRSSRRKSSQQGERSNSARLTPQDVLFIRNSTLTQKALARCFGVHRTTIHKVRANKSWASY